MLVSLTVGCAGQLSINIAMLRLSSFMRRSSFQIGSQSSKIIPVIHAFLLAVYSTGTFAFLKALGFILLPMTNKGNFSDPFILLPTNMVIRCFDCLEPWCDCPAYPRELSGNISQKRLVSSALKTSFGEYFSSTSTTTNFPSFHTLTTSTSTPLDSPDFLMRTIPCRCLNLSI